MSMRKPPPTKPPVHLFIGGSLVADRWTQRERPSDFYVVDGAFYDVVDYYEVTEASGSIGFKVELAARIQPIGSPRGGPPCFLPTEALCRTAADLALKRAGDASSPTERGA